jgi:hypothetical protein
MHKRYPIEFFRLLKGNHPKGHGRAAKKYFCHKGNPSINRTGKRKRFIGQTLRNISIILVTLLKMLQNHKLFFRKKRLLPHHGFETAEKKKTKICRLKSSEKLRAVGKYKELTKFIVEIVYFKEP